jgi:hypothetical protein
MIRAFRNDPELFPIAGDPRYLRVFNHSQLSASSRALPWRGNTSHVGLGGTLSAAENEAPWREATPSSPTYQTCLPVYRQQIPDHSHFELEAQKGSVSQIPSLLRQRKTPTQPWRRCDMLNPITMLPRPRSALSLCMRGLRIARILAPVKAIEGIVIGGGALVERVATCDGRTG